MPSDSMILSNKQNTGTIELIVNKDKKQNKESFFYHFFEAFVPLAAFVFVFFSFMLVLWGLAENSAITFIIVFQVLCGGFTIFGLFVMGTLGDKT